MESNNKLSVLEKNQPLRAFLKDDGLEEILDNHLKGAFRYWLANLLSLKEDKKEIVLNALNEVKYHFHSLGLDDVKKAFEMYARCKLSLKPISNHFDVVLVGQIFKEYNELRPKKIASAPELPMEEKDRLIQSGMKKCILNYEENTQVLDGYNLFLYDILFSDGYLPKDKETKNKALKDAKDSLEIEYLGRKPKSIDDRKKIKNVLESIKNPRSSMVIIKAKEIMVMKFLRETYRNESLVKELRERYKID
jgi:hypothetical protein